MTATAVMMGSPLYMAPEQMASAKDVDARADIWSLGIILHTMLTGSPPFRAPSVMQVYELIVQGAPPIRKQRADVPEGIETAILKCLQKDRLRRYADVGELADAIAGFGPPEARFTANRIKRILVARASQDNPPSSGDAPVPVVAVTPAAVASTELAPSGIMPAEADASAATGGSVDVSISGPSEHARSSLGPIDALGTEGPWDQRTHPPSRRPRPAMLIAAATVLIAAPVAFLVLRAVAMGNPGGGPQAPPSAAVAMGNPGGGPQVAPGATVAMGNPEGVPQTPPGATGSQVSPSATGPQASPQVSPSPTGPQASPGATGTPAVVRVPPAAKPPAPPHVPVHAKSPDDLFGTQK